MIPEELKYTQEHEWVKVEGNRATVGITDHAQSQLGDVVFVELPQVGSEHHKGDSLASVESVKAVSDVYAPVSGKVVEVNAQLQDHAELVNQEPYGRGWIVVLEMSDPSELDQLLSAADYGKVVQEAGE